MVSPNALQELSLFWSGARKKPPIRYTTDLLRLPQHIVSKYVPMSMDNGTEIWLKSSSNVSVTKILLADLLCSVCSRTTANGIVGRGGMFVLSTQQAMRLLLGNKSSNNNNNNNKQNDEYINNNHNSTTDNPNQNNNHQPLFDSLLDIGAGDGGVTARLQPLFRHVCVTECSSPMRWRLWWRGYELLPENNPFQHPDGTRRYYDVISCLNVLDRADKPLGLLQAMRDALKPNGILLLAVVLPWCPFVEYKNEQRPPSEKLPMEGGECCRGASFEDSLQRLVDNVLIPNGFELERWSRVPYLCEGNLRVEYAVLSDAVLVLKRNEEDRGRGGGVSLATLGKENGGTE
ncbi:DREV methyltransferase [Trypanosoma melophagium]|uniref:DREV methyltransferase n=1 Tax=Trypanosoma melophagium TaxID=715481 RepID=UPI00351A7877|nr:DREV methyltransferase [Trypanosoma melophagium]